VAQINEHLPPEIRVFQATRVTKSFESRSTCCARSYELLVPVAALGLTSGDPVHNQTRVDTFRQALELYQGWHPFHNFTNRKQYAPKARTPEDRAARTKTPKQAISSLDEDDTEAEGKEEDKKIDLKDLGLDPRSLGMGGESWERYYSYWLEEVDEHDRVGQSHWRIMHYCTCGDVEKTHVGDEEVQFLRVRLKGNGFMIHQIRYMVGAAVAVANSVISLEYLRSSMCIPARVRMPRAPPHTLALVHADFYPSRLPSGEVPPPDMPPALELEAPGAQLRDDFHAQHLLPHLARLLRHEDWAPWTQDLSLYQPTLEQEKNLLEKSRQWEADNVAKNIIKAAERKLAEEKREAEEIREAEEKSATELSNDQLNKTAVQRLSKFL